MKIKSKSEKTDSKLPRAKSLAKQWLSSKRRSIDFYARTHFKEDLVYRCEELASELRNERMHVLINQKIAEQMQLLKGIDSYDYDNELEEILLKTCFEMELLKLDYPIDENKKKKKGRRKTDKEICEILLSAIHFCENYKINPVWIKDFMMPNNRLYHAIMISFSSMDVTLPVPSNELNGNLWLHKLKETLQRNLFTPEGSKVKKKNDSSFYEAQKAFYAKLDVENDQLLEYFFQLQNDPFFRHDWDWEPDQENKWDFTPSDYVKNQKL